MDGKQLNMACMNMEVVLNKKDSGDCVPFSVTRKTCCFKNLDVRNSYTRGGYFSVIGSPAAWSDALNHIRRQELLASGFTEEQVGLDGKLYGVNEVEHKNDWRRIV